MTSLWRFFQVAVLLTVFTGELPAETASPFEWKTGAWTLAVLPDTQRYSEHSNLNDIFDAQTQWIVDNKANRNIQFVLHEGDVTDNNNTTEWDVARPYVARLNNNGIPYAICLGNHDIGPSGNAANRDTLFNDQFNAAHGAQQWAYANLGDQSFGTGAGAGVFKAGEMENSYHLFSAGGTDYVVLALEFGPRDNVVAWADQVLSHYETEDPGRKAILLTHAYQKPNGDRHNWALDSGGSHYANPHSYGMAAMPGGVNDGEELWDELLEDHENVAFVFSGHVISSSTAIGGYLGSTGTNGNIVHQLVANYQEHDVAAAPPGSNNSGYMRLLQFDPDGQIHVMTYSPYLDSLDPATYGDLPVYLSDANHQFTIPEPASGLLMVVGLAVVGLRRRWRGGLRA